MDKNPGEVREEPAGSSVFYRKDPSSGLYQRLEASGGLHEQLVDRAKVYLFAVLGIVYVLAVLLLELVIIPRYVYRPIQLTLDADRATREDDRQHEIIDANLIPGDEIGDIMRSRNQTVTELREQEASLAQALAVQEELARDLQHKNNMLEAAKQSMMIQDRLVSLGLLSASVAHELNTPLAVLHGSIEKLLETVHDLPTRGRLERMQRVAIRLQRISAGLLDFSRTRKHEDVHDSVPLQPLINEAWDLVAIDERAAGVTFSNDVHPDHQVLGDGDRLMQVFVNLLRNALLAVPVAAGRITVYSEQVALEGREWILASVDDNGIGIPEDVLPNLFEAFVTSRLDSQGTGLGLTVANGIVERHGGAIVASNRPDGGARLQVKLPAAAVAAGSREVVDGKEFQRRRIP
jgi:signal transduction histidine kinase